MKLRFVYSKQYDDALVKARFDHIPEGYPNRKQSVEFAMKLKEGISKLWEPVEDRVLDAIARETGIAWDNDPIVCYINNYTLNSFSGPLTISTIEGKRNPEDAIIILVHELCHVNLTLAFPRSKNYFVPLEKRYPGEHRNTINHIPVNAILTKVLPEALGEETLQWEVEHTGTDEHYRRAWEIVDELGAENVLKELRDALAI